MTCPRCHFQFEKAGSQCPECGIRLLHKLSGVMKTSAVMIAAGRERGFYTSVHEVPEPLRSRLVEITAGANSGTIVIADRAGKEQLTRIMASREAERECSPGPAISSPPEKPPVLQTSGMPWLAWAGLVLVLAIAAVISALFELH